MFPCRFGSEGENCIMIRADFICISVKLSEESFKNSSYILEANDWLAMRHFWLEYTM